MKRYEIIKKTKMNSDGYEYDRFYIRKSFLGIKYIMTKSLFNVSDNSDYMRQSKQEAFILLAFFVNATILLMNLIDDNFDTILGFGWSTILLTATIYLHYKLFPLRFNSLENAKDYIALIIKRKKFKSSITKVANYNIDLEYFEENNRLVRINKLKL